MASVAEPVRFESAPGKKIIGSRYKKSVHFQFIPGLSRKIIGVQDYVVHSSNSFLIKDF